MIRRIIGIIPALIIVHLTASSLLGPTGVGLGQMWEMSDAQIVWLQVAFLLGIAVRTPIGLFVVSIAGDRFVFLLALIVSAVASGVFYLYADDFIIGFILRLIMGAAIGAMIIPACNMLSNSSLIIGSMLVALTVAAGWVLSIELVALTSKADISGLLTFLPAGGGWTTIYLLAAVAGVVWWLLALLLLPRTRH